MLSSTLRTDLIIIVVVDLARLVYTHYYWPVLEQVVTSIPPWLERVNSEWSKKYYSIDISIYL